MHEVSVAFGGMANATVFAEIRKFDLEFCTNQVILDSALTTFENL